MLKVCTIPADLVSGLRGYFSLLGYLQASCDWLWELLCPLETVLGIQFSPFFPVRRSLLVFRLLQNLESEEDSVEFSPSSKIASSPLNLKL